MISIDVLSLKTLRRINRSFTAVVFLGNDVLLDYQITDIVSTFLK